MQTDNQIPTLERQDEILAEIIQYYLQNHEAISARTLSKISRLDLSPTTIRNLMEDLSSEGFLTNRGVSRGRIPTQKAFTIYVTTLRRYQPPPKPERIPLPAEGEGNSPHLANFLNAAGEFLTGRTGYVALASLPPRDNYPLDWIRLTQVPSNQVLVAVRSLLGDLWSKLVDSPDLLSAELLKSLERYLCQTYRGVSLEMVRGAIMSGGQGELQEITGAGGGAYRLLRKSFEWDSEPGTMTWRTINLYDIEEFREPGVLAQLHEALKDNQLLTKALAGGKSVDGGKVAIGTDIGVKGMESAALVGFPFTLNSEWGGLLAVLGPMRMNYSLVIQQLKQATDYLNLQLKESSALVAV